MKTIAKIKTRLKCKKEALKAVFGPVWSAQQGLRSAITSAPNVSDNHHEHGGFEEEEAGGDRWQR